MTYKNTLENTNPEPGKQARSILVAGADDGTRLYVRVILKQHGYEVVETADAAAALAALAGGRADLCIVDLTVLGVAGLALCREINARTETRRYPVLALAGRGRPDSAPRARSAGADGILRKPVLSGDLLAEVRQLLNGKGGHRAS